MKKILLILIVILFSACHNQGFDQRVVIPEAAWDVNNRVPFDVTVNDTTEIYSFGMNLRHWRTTVTATSMCFCTPRCPTAT